MKVNWGGLIARIHSLSAVMEDELGRVDNWTMEEKRFTATPHSTANWDEMINFN